MGQCLSCLRDSDPVKQEQKEEIHSSQVFPYPENFENTEQSISLRLLCSGNHHSALRTASAPPDYKSNKENLFVRHNLSLREQSLIQSTVVSESNGKNVKEMPEKRSFYSRIPPLSKSSCENRRALKEVSQTKLNTLFDTYKDSSNPDSIMSEGIIRLCCDLDVKPDDFRILLLAWKLKAETMCKFTREEFMQGCKSLKVDSIRAIHSKFPEMLAEVQNPEKFKDLYRFTYKFGLDSESGQRILQTDMAILLWKLVFSQNVPKILPRWIAFLEKHHSIRGISCDTWNMFLNFTESVADDLTTYDDTEAWPSLIDDFVEYENDQLNQNISKEQKSQY